MTKSWSELEPDFRRLFQRLGPTRTAEAANVDRTTVYRLLAGKTKRPHASVRDSIERAVEQQTERGDEER